MKKKSKKSKDFNINQKSFFFEDYLETNKKNKFLQKNNLFQDRIYILFFLFFSLILIFSIRIVHVSLNKIETQNENLIIEENGRHQYSKDYKKLTREFYTIFD